MFHFDYVYKSFILCLVCSFLNQTIAASTDGAAAAAAVVVAVFFSVFLFFG